MDVQYGAHSPVVLLLAWLFGPSVRGFLAYWLTLWLIFGLGIIALARQWKVPAWGGLLVALGLTFSGFFVGHAEHTPVLFSWVWMPLLLWRLEVALARNAWAAGAQAGVIFGLSALGGYPAILFTNSVFPDLLDRRVCLPPRGLRATGRRRAASLAGWCLAHRHPHGCRLCADRTAWILQLLPRGSRLHESHGLDPARAGRSIECTSPASAPDLCKPLSGHAPVEDSLGLHRYLVVQSLCGRTRVCLCGLLDSCSFSQPDAMGAGRRNRLRGNGVAGPRFAFARLVVRSGSADAVRAYAIFLLGVLALLGIRDLARSDLRVNRRRRLMIATVSSAILAGIAYLVVLKRAHPANHLQGDIHFLLAWVGPFLVAPWASPSRLAQKRAWVPVAFCLLAATDAILGAGLANTLGVAGDWPKWKWAEVERQHRSGLDCSGSTVPNAYFSPGAVPTITDTFCRVMRLFAATAAFAMTFTRNGSGSRFSLLRPHRRIDSGSRPNRSVCRRRWMRTWSS